ncbi:hypothetical protein HG536_0F03120 [Torulaspora globosa]|uniref:UAA transporter n=1 Tax=Torulaspora globosa TaxID=48254 RepID=A0A7G3ZKF1_9SACH|nr:uncharacterized protein HG536_0F03120 [Torulaspora globosa]QLL33987.1 hypothetical protein HG536_0F03120 [Torulaspora globosa]
MWNTVGAIVYIFGGCCSNVLTLESIIDQQTNRVGSLLTFCQFAVASIEGLYNFLDYSSRIPRLRTPKVPLKVYVLMVILYYTSSVTNNSVFQYGISVPLHIVFRCSGTVITMIMGWLLAGKRYSVMQVFSASLMTIGAIITTLFKDREFSKETTIQKMLGNVSSSADSKFLVGISMLFISSIASSTLSICNEWSYRKYGKHWKESLFYTHALALPLFFLDYKELYQEFWSFVSQRPSAITLLGHTFRLSKLNLLAANIITQHICVRGVNLLACYTSAVTLSTVLLARKVISLLLSVHLFGGTFSTTGYVGIIIVLLGTLIYVLNPNDNAVGSKRRTT